MRSPVPGDTGAMFAWAERHIPPTVPPEGPPPSSGLLAFYWHFIAQARGAFAALFGAAFTVALLDTMVPLFMGRVVTLLERHEASALLRETWPELLGMAVVLLLLRPAALVTQQVLASQVIAANFTNRIRWQSHWHVVRQGWSFFQNDFAGRIATRVMQTGPSLRESVVASLQAVWYLMVYGAVSIVALAALAPALVAPVLVWFVAYILLLRGFVPRLRDRAKATSEARSALTGRIVDTYSNILTVKLFARTRDQDEFVRDGINRHTTTFLRQLRLITVFSLSLNLLSAAMVTATAGLAVWLWTEGAVRTGMVAAVLPLTWQLLRTAGWVADSVTGIFENVGTVQEGMLTIAKPLRDGDREDAVPLVVTRGAIRYENVSFGYGAARGVIRELTLDIAPGERVALVGHSGAGKSTLINLLLGFFPTEQGRILIDGQDIAGVTQESLRQQIAVVTQDTSLLHRTIRENIRFGRPDATEEEVIEAARMAAAHDFIQGLSDWDGRAGYDARVGERGVKLSGGQRQRVAIARVILKGAPILVLDEATSALDSESEAVIQEQLETLMAGRTVIAVAHRLSTIARMDRLVVMEEGRIVEQGSHAELLAAGGAYARMWSRQSGGFLDDPAQAGRLGYPAG
ncbi:ABC transporter ATP-binding protein [Elioraea rosea]|uniref:ABC transporter ATP-binding protein n=1 Tax=Elioraea rosea TaxID=2492390 RepID=UPI001EF53117|nr:ABC transporter ATP-binding protein [Elioraea rosea]